MKWILAICTILGGYVALKEIIGSETTNLVFLFGFVLTTAYYIPKYKPSENKNSFDTLDRSSDSGFKGSIIKNIVKGGLGKYSVAYNEFLYYKSTNAEVINREVIRKYICPILNNVAVGDDEFEKEEVRENIESIKNDLRNRKFIAESVAYIAISDYDFSKHGFYVLFHCDDFNNQGLTFDIDHENSIIENKFFVKIKDKTLAKEWKKDFYALNDDLLLRGLSVMSPGGMESVKIQDTCDLVIKIKDCTFDSGPWDATTMFSVSIVGMSLKDTRFPEVPV